MDGVVIKLVKNCMELKKNLNVTQPYFSTKSILKGSMRIPFFKIYIFMAVLGCQQPHPAKAQTSFEFTITNDDNTLNGAEQLDAYLGLLKNKKVAIVANHTSMVGTTHLVDTLVSLKVQVVKVFAPEHGFRGMADAGEKVNTATDEKTGLPIISLYGKNKKPTADQLKEVDVVLFDIQDVGARFYTYISTMTYVMEACAENKKQMIVLDRPNPNGFYVDGPVMQTGLKSFVGMHPVPIVHGMTVGEYAQMLNGEKWLTNGVQCNLQVIPVKNYNHLTFYQVPIPPSPNLKTMAAIYFYPTTCLFEGTNLSIGRGTDDPFTLAGSPAYTGYSFHFTPVSKPGAKDPKFKDQVCYGIDFKDEAHGSDQPLGEIRIEWVVEMYQAYENKDEFFTNFFDQLAGNTTLKADIIKDTDGIKLKKLWKTEVDQFKLIRKKYLLYKDFE
jgi:uncharacterized protein YbbC (DUF1343 family)